MIVEVMEDVRRSKRTLWRRIEEFLPSVVELQKRNEHDEEEEDVNVKHMASGS